MRDTIAHRGPDDAGLWIGSDGRIGLGHRRLSIIDLSPAGRQPMQDAAGSLTIVFNGEIYNYRSLRSRLESGGCEFRTQSDTEVILGAFKTWGAASATRLRGMFAFAVWNDGDRTLTLVRDHTGIKPLFYYWDGETFAFASEIKALLAMTAVDDSLDRSAIWDALTYGYTPGAKTAYQHIRKLAPGHWLRFSDGSLRLSRYWDVPLDPDPSITEDQAVRLVQDRLQDAVAMSLVSDVQVGVLLSGGLDSSAVLAEMSRCSSVRHHSFSIGFDVAGHSETAYAKIVADLFKTVHHERTVGRESLQQMLPRVVSFFDEPFADSSSIPTFRVAQLAREHVKVVLSGDGGDEVFGGYAWYDRWLRQRRASAATPRWIQGALLRPAGALWPSWAPGVGVKRFLTGFGLDALAQYAAQIELFTPRQKRLAFSRDFAAEFEGYDDYWYFREYWRDDVDPRTCIQYLDLKTYLPDDILTKVDRSTMAVALEARPPLLDHELVEAMFRIPASIRFRAGGLKHVFRLALREVLPETILQRPKKGFSSPVSQWVKADRPWIRQRLASGPLPLGGISAARLGRLGWGAKLWTLLVVSEWAERHRARFGH